MGKRSGKWYSRNEKEVMQELGFKPTPASGSGWIHKEDGQSSAAIAQLKSTDALSIGVSLHEIRKLEHNAHVSRKKPIFVIQFIESGDVFLVIRPSKKILSLIHEEPQSSVLELVDQDDIDILEQKQITAGDCGDRQKFYDDREATRIETQNKAGRKVRRTRSETKPERELNIEL